VADARLGVDVGGTFTDLVALVDGELVTAKVPSTPEDQSDGAMRAVEAAGLEPGDVGAFAHGMTVASCETMFREQALSGSLQRTATGRTRHLRSGLPQLHHG